MTSKSMEVRDGVGLLSMGDTLLVLWAKPASLDRWGFQLNRMEKMVVSRVEGILVLVIIMSVDTPPDVTVRNDMQAAVHRLGPKLRRLVAVPLGHSVWLSIIRTVVRGLLIVSGESKRHRVAAS